MKRGWIAWDQSELPRAVFDARLERLRWRLTERDLPAAVIYTDVWRSNRARHFSNFMPYWNRALLVVPCDSQPILLSGLSSRVFSWIRSVTILDEIRPSPNLAHALTALAREKGWARLGILDLLQLPADLAGSLPIETVNLTLPFEPDPAELSMYRTAARLARTTLAEELPAGRGLTDHAFTSRLERRFRRAGAEDLVILLTNGRTVPAPPRGETLGPDFSISLALEYRGHWVKIARSASARDPFPSRIHVETLSGPYPYEISARLETPALLAMRFESRADELRLFHGDTYLSSEKGLELL